MKMKTKTTISVSYLSSLGIDNSLEKEILALAKGSEGKAGGGSGFSFEDSRRDFLINFPNLEKAEQFLKNIKGKFKKFKVQATL